MPSIPGTERSQGYAFVEFASVESAVLAVSKLNRYMLPLSERPFFEDARVLMNAKPLATAVENGAVTTEQLEQVAMNLDLHVISKYVEWSVLSSRRLIITTLLTLKTNMEPITRGIPGLPTQPTLASTRRPTSL